jgi:hypothetical protein
MVCMPELSAEQTAIVTHGDPAVPDIVYAATPTGLSLVMPSGVIIDATVIDGGVRLDDDIMAMRYCPADDPVLDTAAGFCMIYQRTTAMAWDPNLGKSVAVLCSPLAWFTRRETSGGGQGSVAYSSRALAEYRLAIEIWRSAMFWEAKIAWRHNDDMTTVPRHRRRTDSQERVIRCNGNHYTIGPEPPSLRHIDQSLLGHGGARFRFRLLDSGEIIESHNVWHQGRIPVEYRRLLPDNAEPPSFRYIDKYSDLVDSFDGADHE